jgi:preprotein translocase subunit SecF
MKEAGEVTAEKKDTIMPKANKPESRKSETRPPKAAEMKASTEQQAQVKKDQPAADKSKQSGKSDKSRVGGTAVPGAKSTQPREVHTTSPAKQEAESYNRMMRRRMQHLGTGPYGEDPAAAAHEKRQKRVERKKKRIEERRQEAKKSIGPGFSTALGRRNTYFLIAIVAIIVIVIVLAIIINHPFK